MLAQRRGEVLVHAARAIATGVDFWGNLGGTEVIARGAYRLAGLVFLRLLGAGLLIGGALVVTGGHDDEGVIIELRVLCHRQATQFLGYGFRLLARRISGYHLRLTVDARLRVSGALYRIALALKPRADAGS